MKELVDRLYAAGWRYLAATENHNELYVYEVKPRPTCGGFLNKTGTKENQIPSCLFPEICYENSPVELATYLEGQVDQESYEQQEIRLLMSWGFVYLLKQGNGYVSAYTLNGAEWRNANRLKDFVKAVHEKVYLKDLLMNKKQDRV